MAHIVHEPDAFDEEHDQDSPRGIEEVEVGPASAHIASQHVKITTTQAKEDTSPILESSRGPSLSTTVEHISDAASAHSLPAVHVTASDPVASVERPSSARAAESSRPAGRIPPLSSSSRTPPPQRDGSLSQQERRARHRSAVVESAPQGRSSNRLSGFFTNLIHRRDNPPMPSARHPIREDQPSPAPGQSSETHSRSSSPPPGRSITPPPQLPAPTLQELGLSLSVLTSDLSPSHFSTPPSSGAFLAPHYLLLCHAQGLDVLPLISPPAPQPYALVRRVSFKSVVVMEQRGVLVAIAGRRDGVRVYALEEVKKAIEWRIEVEVRRERDRLRRENIKKFTIDGFGNDIRESTDKFRKTSLSTPPPGDPVIRANLLRKGSYGPLPSPPPPPLPAPAPLIPRTPTTPAKKTKTRTTIPPQIPQPSGQPPPYSSPSTETPRPSLRSEPSVLSLSQTRSRSGSVGDVLGAAPISLRNTDAHNPNRKTDEWAESSDDEAIDIVAAGSSGSQALDERTSALNAAQPELPTQSVTALPRNSMSSTSRRSRPSNLDLTLSRTNTAVIPPEPSPDPTLLTFRRALSHSPASTRNVRQLDDPDTPFVDGEDDDDDADGGISLAQALLESRMPDLPPLGTMRPQQPILLTSSHLVATGEDEPPSSPRTSDGHSGIVGQDDGDGPVRQRRRWSVMLSQTIGPITPGNSNEPPLSSPAGPPTSTSPSRERSSSRFSRSHSFRSGHSQATTIRPSASSNEPLPTSLTSATTLTSEITPSLNPTQSSRSSRFIPRLISNAFNNRRSDDRPTTPLQKFSDSDNARRVTGTQIAPHAPPPKLEYVKLPGTKGAIMVKSVETAKKSFLAILCGDNGEKVELFAGTYRTALGLSRTFILPDSPRSLELQLQGDDLVEVFLVFSQNVFGLEPATVRVREVRIGRAERRAARRRAREVRVGDAPSGEAEVEAPEEDTNVNVSIGVSVAVGSTVVASGDGPSGPQPPPLVPREHPNARLERPSTPTDPVPSTSVVQAEEIVALATAQMGPYTTFQQLTFAPKFPLASIADEYIIPPTYPDFLDYRSEYEPGVVGHHNPDLAQVQFSPPGLPVPAPAAPSKWYYRDPKNVVHGPWKATLMQAWYKDGLLPPDLPVRRDEDTEYILLKDLRLQSVDPSQPFRSPPAPYSTSENADKPLLSPISLLAQPRHFGPPALFFSSRGGHSTAIVDARGRSVLKGRFVWSNEDYDEDSKSVSMSRMGDVKRLEAFDVKDRAVLVAMRQGGLEAVDLGDALLKPADESRTVLPQFSPPLSNINRREPFVWKIGTPVSASPTSATILSSKSKSGHGYGHLPSKKQSTGLAKSPAGRTEFSVGDSAESDSHDEVLFLGRKDDEIYICERNAGFFRILRLCPTSP